MRNNKLHTTVAVLLLALMLISRVGLHLFHHHEYKQGHAHKAATSIVLVSESETEAADCALCKLDAFQLFAIEALSIFVFFLTLVKAVDRFLLTVSDHFSIYTQNRGPPAVSFLIP